MEIYTVTQVARYLREILDSNSRLADLWIRGEISNLRQSTVGHLYFTLKDADSQLRCVYFHGSEAEMELTGGMAVVAHGHVSLYETRGELQFYVDLVQPEGMGLLHLEFERLKAKLEGEGLFDPSRKRPLPPFPRRIGVVTSPVGAVFQDILHVIGRRYPLVELVLASTPVQGEGAVEGIVQALESLNACDGTDLVIVARGGGSLEELWAFNEERVARAIYASRAPVITGIGHETDLTIADFVADCRAPTPSAAAELAVPDRAELEGQLRAARRALGEAVAGRITERRDSTRSLGQRLQRLAPDVGRYRQQVDELSRNTLGHLRSLMALRREQVESRLRHLGSLSPLRTLERGYAAVQRPITGEVISSVGQVRSGDGIEVWVRDGSFGGRVTRTGRRRRGAAGIQERMRGLLAAAASGDGSHGEDG